MENFIQLLNKINDFVWGLPLIILLLGTGIYYTFLLKGLQFRKLGHSLYLAFIKFFTKSRDFSYSISTLNDIS